MLYLCFSICANFELTKNSNLFLRLLEFEVLWAAGSSLDEICSASDLQELRSDFNWPSTLESQYLIIGECAQKRITFSLHQKSEKTLMLGCSYCPSILIFAHYEPFPVLIFARYELLSRVRKFIVSKYIDICT